MLWYVQGLPVLHGMQSSDANDGKEAQRSVVIVTPSSGLEMIRVALPPHTLGTV